MNTKLTAEDIQAIRSMHGYGPDDWSTDELADQFGVHASNIRYIIRRKTWKDVPDIPLGAGDGTDLFLRNLVSVRHY